MIEVTATVTDSLGGVSSDTAEADIVKPYAAGLYSRHASWVDNHPGWTDTITHEVTWAQLESTQGVYDFSVIDNLLARYPGYKVRLAVRGGPYAPPYVADATGTVEVYMTVPDVTVFVPHVWELGVFDWWAAFQDALAAEYDSEPLIEEVLMPLLQMRYMEPPILGGDDPSAIRLFDAGLNEQTMHDSILQSHGHVVATWPTTRVDFCAHTSLQTPTADGMTQSWPKMRAMLNELHFEHLDRLVVTNNGLGPGETRPPEPLDTASHLYAWTTQRSALGFACGHQFTGAPTEETQRQTVQEAIDAGAHWCETWGWHNDRPIVEDFQAQLKANAAS